MSNLPPVGVISYNGFVFSEAAETTSLRIRPVKSTDGRTITHSVISIEILDYIVLPIGQELTSQTMVIALTQPACEFFYNSRGTGNIAINTGAIGQKPFDGQTNSWDVVWGPMPTMIEMKPMGGGNGIRFKWAVDVAIPTCAGATFFGDEQPMEFNYKLQFDIDRGGYTKRTYSGFVRIPQTRFMNSRVPFVSADNWRTQINPPTISGFRRIPGKFTLSDDRNRLDFEIVDEQFPSSNALPPGCVEAEASHTFSSKSLNATFWTSTISATYELATGQNLNTALAAFLPMAQRRITFAANNVALVPGPLRAPALRPFFQAIQFNMAETKIYDKPTASLSLTYTAIGTTQQELLNKGGLFTPAAPTGFFGRLAAGPAGAANLWATSLAPILGSRGISGLGFDPKGDAILDLCVLHAPEPPLGDVQMGGGPKPPSKFVQMGGGQLIPGIAGKSVGGVIASSGADSGLAALFPPVTPNNSWMDFQPWLSVETESGLVIGSTLPPTPLSQGANSGAWQPLVQGLPGGSALESTFFPQAADVGLGQPGSQNQGSGNSLQATFDNPTFVQQRTQPIVYVTLHGYAVRAGFQIPIPQLLTVGGLTATPCGRADRGEGFEQTAIGNVTVPLYVAKWKLRYVLTPGIPNGSFVVPSNPLLGA
jgi:hypothetical protein